MSGLFVFTAVLCKNASCSAITVLRGFLKIGAKIARNLVVNEVNRSIVIHFSIAWIPVIRFKTFGIESNCFIEIGHRLLEIVIPEFEITTLVEAAYTWIGRNVSIGIVKFLCIISRLRERTSAIK